MHSSNFLSVGVALLAAAPGTFAAAVAVPQIWLYPTASFSDPNSVFVSINSGITLNDGSKCLVIPTDANYQAIMLPNNIGMDVNWQCKLYLKGDTAMDCSGPLNDEEGNVLGFLGLKKTGDPVEDKYGNSIADLTKAQKAAGENPVPLAMITCSDAESAPMS